MFSSAGSSAGGGRRVGRRAVVDLALVREREGPRSEFRIDVMGEVSCIKKITYKMGDLMIWLM